MFHHIEEDITPVIQAMGYQLVEINCHLHKKTLSVTLYVYKESGIGSEDCDLLMLALRPRIETLIHPQSLSLSISSPGVYRTLKSNKEYSLFVGKQIRIVLHDGKTFEGILQAADKDGIVLLEQRYLYENIAKSKLI